MCKWFRCMVILEMDGTKTFVALRHSWHPYRYVDNGFTCKQMGWPSQRHGKLTNHFTRALVLPLVLQQRYCQIDIHTKCMLCTTETSQNAYLQCLLLIYISTYVLLFNNETSVAYNLAFVALKVALAYQNSIWQGNFMPNKYCPHPCLAPFEIH